MGGISEDVTPDELTAAKSAAGTADTYAKTAAQQEADDRSQIARLIINIFVGAVAAVLILLALEGFLDRLSWPDVTTKAADLIKTSVLPVVTLVLGYYFGRSAKG